MSVDTSPVLQDGVRRGSEQERIQLAFYHTSRAYLDAIERFFFESHFYKIKLASTKLELDPMLFHVITAKSAVVVDTHMPGAKRFCDQLEACRGPEVRIIIMALDDDRIPSTPQAGAIFFLNNYSLLDLVTVMARPLVGPPQKKVMKPPSLLPLILTEREWEVFGLIVKGWTRREIADHIHRGVKTVDNHRHNIMQKLDIKGTNVMFTRLAAERGWRF